MRYLTCFVCFLLVPGLAMAEEEEDDEEHEQGADIDQVGMSLAVGAGYGLAAGEVYRAPNVGTNTRLGDVVSGQVPVALSLGVRPIPHLSLGIALQHGRLLMKSCEAGRSCSGTNTHLGLELRLHLIPDQPGCPWLAFGVGYEWLSLSGAGDRLGDVGLRGRSYGIELGIDIRMTRYLGVGPFAGVRFGSYGTSNSGAGSTGDVPIPDEVQTTHAWWIFGVRGAFTVSKL